MARLLRVLVVSLLSVFVSLLLLSNAQAQVSSVNNTTSTPIEGAGHDYVKLLSETVNPANGAVSIRIELPTPKSRGITLPFSIAYDSNGVLHLEPSQIIPQGYGTANWATDIGFLSQGGWSYSVPLLNYNTWGVDHPYIIGYDSGGGPNWGHHNCYYASGYLFKDAAGSRHSLHLGALSIAAVDYPDATSECADLRRSGGGDADVWGALAPYPGESGYYGELPVTVSDKNGMSYTFPAGNQFTVPGTKPLTNFVLPSKIEDGNGNIVNVTRNGSTTSYAMTDTAGRSVLLVNGFGTSGTTVTADGATYQVTWKTVTFGSYSVNPIWKGQGSGPSGGDYCAPIPSVNGGSEVVISQVTLPNGQSYKFYYGSDNPDVSFRNPYGMLSEIDYPSGGSVKYKWALTGTRGELGVYPAAYSAGGDVTPDANYCIYQYQTPAVSERDVFYGGSTTPA
ncbi:MAG TPA: hypothetical protein VGA01_01510, partial [Candidatus Binatia bacterium]